MHTNRDALPALLSAWVLHPGTCFRCFDLQQGEIRSPARMPRALSAVGVASLVPGEAASDVVELLKTILG